MKSTFLLSALLCAIVFTRCEPVGKRLLQSPELLAGTRRILNGKEAGETRPYMVYLRPATQADKQFRTSNWMCGGVIIHARFILTSAACIEDVKNFYVVSGTNVWSQDDTECIKNGAKKAIWKCIPKDYFFDGAEFDNIHWMSGDIAVVKVEDEFNFQKRVQGCEYIPNKIAYNNISLELENAKTMGSLAGWGSTSAFENSFKTIVNRASENSVKLLETDVEIISKNSCKKLWEPRYHKIIDQAMICSKDTQDASTMDAACIEGGVSCKEIEYSAESQEDDNKRFRARSRKAIDPKELQVHGAGHYQLSANRRFKVETGGFCENDHGGPLIVGHGATSIVIGVMSACMTRDISMKCYGPYLYTSVYNYKLLISCAIDKDAGTTETCRKAFGVVKTYNNQISEVTFDWKHNLPNKPQHKTRVSEHKKSVSEHKRPVLLVE